MSCDSHSHLSLVVSIGFNNKLVLSSTSCMSTIMMCHFIIIFNTAGSIEVYQEESQNHMYTNMATKDESELVPSSSKGSHLEPVSAAVKALKDHEDKLVTSLKDTDLVSLARFGLEGGFISQDVKESLESMDPNVHWLTKIRYLFLHVYESLQSNPRLYERWLKLLSEHGASSEALEQVRLSYEGYCARESEYSVSAMTESLADGNSEELSGNGSAAGSKRPHDYAPLEESVLKRPCLEVALLEVLSQTCDCNVSEEKSALLEVQVSANHETTITYQWMKDGAPLSDDSTYCGTHKQILCINDVTMASEGTYYCEVQTHENEKLQSEPIKLTVVVPPERVKSLNDYEDELVTSLKDADLVSFAKEALETGFTPQTIKNSFDLLDSNVPSSLKIRYLFMYAYERTTMYYEKWLNLLSRFGVTDALLGQVRQRYEWYTRKVSGEESCVSESDEVVVGMKRPHGSNFYFTQKHVSVLTEILADHSHKWHDIGIELSLPHDILHDIATMLHIYSTSRSRLGRLLSEWIVGGHEYAKPPTVESLEQALNSKTVGLGSVGSELQETLQLHGVCLINESPMDIVRQTHDLKVNEEKSTLLEVQLSTSHDTTITYQWMKDGAPLNDNSTYCGIHKQILCINDVTMASEGIYLCEVQTDENKKLQSEPIKLTVIISPEKVKALRDYEDELVIILKDADLTSFAKEALETGFISQTIKNSFDLLDSCISCSLKIRYLFMYAYERIDNNSSIHYEKWLNLLSQFGVTDDLLGQVRHSPIKRPYLQVTSMKIIRQTRDLKVNEEKSTLLEVQVSHDTTITYQWMKDGAPLSDNSTYCGTHKQIQCINDVTMASEGTYHCEVQTHENEKLQSEPIKLIVKVSPEKKVLIDMYLSQPEVPKDTWPPVSNNTYINLALIKPGAIDKAGKYAYNTIQGDVDDILKDKDRIEYEEVFSNLVSGTLLLIEGRPGSGKTTLVHKFSQDWASGKLNLKNVRFLFLVHLRVLLNDPSIKLRDILKHYYEDQVRLDQILDHSERFSGEGLCFVFDGLDEYSPKGKKNTTIFKLINKQLLPKSIVVVASRPAAVVHLKSVATKRVEVLGFQKEQISQYIKEYKFSNVEKIQNLESYLEQHPNVHHMCYLPIHASMVCYLFNLMGTALARTETEMYTSFMIHTLLRTVMRCDENERYLQSPDDLPDMERGIFFQICKLAFEKTVSSKQVMKHSEIKHFFKDMSCGKESLGLITVDCIAAKFGFQDLYTFLHLTFQEYLAAYHITKLGEEEQTKIIEKYGKKKHMRVVWKFYCGLIVFENDTKKFEKLVKCSESPDDLFHIQCAFESQKSIVCDSVIWSGEEGSLALKNHFLTPSDLTAIGFVVRTASESHPVKKLVLNRCTLREEGISAFLKEAGDRVMSIQTLCCHGGNCNMTQLKSVNVLLGKMSALETLDISDTKLGPLKVQALTNNITLPNLETLVVGDSAFLKSLKFNSPKVRLVKLPEQCLLFDRADWFIRIFGLSTFLNSICELSRVDFLDLHNHEHSYSDVKLVSKCLEQHSHCTRLILTNCNVGDDGAKTCAVGLSHCAGLKELVLNVNNIGDEGSIALAETLTKNPFSHLEKLDISFNGIGDSGAKSLSEGLILCTNLHSLDLRCNKIGDEGAIAITRAVKDVELLLCNQKITKEGAHALFDIKHDVDISSMDFFQIDCAGVALSVFCSNTCGSHYNLQLLNLQSKAIRSDGAKSLAECLKHCTNLQTLNLYSNSIGDDGAKALAEGLKHCTNLQTLNLRYNSIGADGAKALAEGLKHCTNLQTLNLRSNSIGADGVKALAEGLKHCTNLQTLNLYNNSIGDDGAKALAESLKHCMNLQTLDVSINSIDTDGAKALAEGLKHCMNLQKLDLDSNSIGADGAKALADHLQHVKNLSY